jgi:hypothetical protein
MRSSSKLLVSNVYFAILESTVSTSGGINQHLGLTGQHYGIRWIIPVMVVPAVARRVLNRRRHLITFFLCDAVGITLDDVDDRLYARRDHAVRRGSRSVSHSCEDAISDQAS